MSEEAIKGPRIRTCHRCRETKTIDQFPNAKHTCAACKRDQHLQRTYKISLADFNQMVASQGNRCPHCYAEFGSGSYEAQVNYSYEERRVIDVRCIACSASKRHKDVKDGPHRRRVTKASRDASIQLMVQRGLSVDQIVEETGLSHTRVNKVARPKAEKPHWARNLTGEEFGRLKVVGVHQARGRQRKWDCLCKCGKSVVATRKQLFIGEAYSCGCEPGPPVDFSKAPPEATPTFVAGDIISGFWNSVVNGAKNRRIEMTITPQEAWGLFVCQGGRCALTGQKLYMAKSSVEFNQPDRPHTASLDRKNSDLSYVRGNVQWIHKDLQRHKHTATNEQFLEIARRVVRHFEATAA